MRIVQTQRGRLVLQVQQAFHLAERMALEERLLHHYQDAITKVRAENRELRAEVRRLQAALRDAEIVIEGLDDGGEDRIDTVSPSPEPSDESTSSRGLPS